MATTATQVVLDTPAAEFQLPATDGKTYALDDVAGEKGTVVVFICNHCPYVKAVIDRMVSDARVLMSESVGFAAICSNDAASYSEDSFENMKRFAKAHDFPFPYLHDETQTVARAYGAVCTPDFFGYNADTCRSSSVAIGGYPGFRYQPRQSTKPAPKSRRMLICTPST